MPKDIMMIGLIIWTFLTAVNYIVLRRPLIGGVYFCYTFANIFMMIIGRK